VLAKFDPPELPEVDRVIARAADAAQMFIVEGIDKVMNMYNADATGPEVD
jgi:peptidyl-tRNA hydrolase